MDFAKTFQEAKKHYGIGESGGFFTIKDGESKKIRLVSDAIIYQSVNKYNDKGGLRTQFLCYIIDREDQKIKPYFMPVSVMSQIVDLQLSQDYGFIDEIPYDITIKRKREGEKVTYSVIPAREHTELTLIERQEIKSLKPLSQIIEKIKAKQEITQEIEQISDE